ncbi:30S ribosomal protein S6 [Absidia repens]|uniref:30S ribosomal protein S6 n=1 Tax=Absidia repens TaxID=90262 RepID=A0A1X2J354_9FUNG|nr:30S ribosomal protein S6 [Absidia repens]
MPFYELVCIARSHLVESNLKDLIRTSATQVLERGGVQLPHRVKRHQQYHANGHYWMMHFDSNPLVVQDLGKKLLVDSRVLRHTFVKLGDKLDTVVTRPDKSL